MVKTGVKTIVRTLGLWLLLGLLLSASQLIEKKTNSYEEVSDGKIRR